MISVEVAYALPHEQKILALQVHEECTAYEAVVRSGIVELFPGIDPEAAPMGIFGNVEIYRPLIADPKEARARRAAKMKAEKGSSEAGN